jgi:hypothetical protein
MYTHLKLITVTYLQDKISSDHIRSRQMFRYMHRTECEHLRTYTWNGLTSIITTL